jgi:hypothetical protein
MKAKGKCFSGINRGQRRKSDFYQTPYSMTRQILDVEKLKGITLEPASGDGAIARILNEYNIRGYFSDIRLGCDYLKEDYGNSNYSNVICNPPFSLAKEFILKSKELYKDKIIMLLPLSYLHGQERFNIKIFKNLKYVYVFTRYPMLTDKVREDGKYNTGMMVYAWYVWKKNYRGESKIRWIDNNKYILKKSDTQTIGDK